MIHFGNLYAALDGKGKVFWANKTAMANCVNCGSTPSEMAKRDGNFRLDPSTLQYGMAAMILLFWIQVCILNTVLKIEISNAEAWSLLGYVVG